jgi:predicted DNA-binding WGR domain protein
MNENLLEQYYQRPAILQTFNWRTINVFAKDWLSQPDKVIELIIKRLQQGPEQEAEEIEDATVTGEAVATAEPVTPGSFVPIQVQPETAATPTPYDHLEFQRLINTEGEHPRFWEAALDGSKLIVRYGRVGTKGQVHVKTFAKESTAQFEKDKMVKEKLGKGYKAG